MHRILLLLLTVSLMLAHAAEPGGPPDSPSSPAPVTTGTGTGTGGQAASSSPLGELTMPLVMVAIFAFIYFAMIRPQKREEKKRKDLTSNVKPGHSIITIGGVHAEVVSVGETTVELRLGSGDRGPVVTFEKTAILTNLTLAPPAAPAK